MWLSEFLTHRPYLYTFLLQSFLHSDELPSQLMLLLLHVLLNIPLALPKSSVENMHDLFPNCSELVLQDLTHFDIECVYFVVNA